MEVSLNALRKEAVAIFKKATDEMAKFEQEAELAGCSPFQVVDTNGNALYASLIATKASALNTLTLLSEQGKKR